MTTCSPTPRHRARAWPLLALALLAGPAQAWMINEDYLQKDDRAATDFHIFLAGDVKAQITGGGTTPVTSPFADPKVKIDKTAIGNTQITFSGSNSLAKDPKANRHFGVYGAGAKPTVRLKAWSYPTTPFLQPVPVTNLAFSYDPGSGSGTVSVQNFSDDTVAVSEAGYLVFNSEQPIEQLTRGSLPPSSFLALSVLDGVLGIGSQFSAVIPNLSPSQYIVAYATLQFAGASLANGYGDGLAGEWAQVSLAAQAVPEPGSVWLMGIGLCGLVLRRRRGLALAALAGLAMQPAAAWERGNHAGDWKKGGTVTISVDTPPGNAAQQAAYLEAVAEAMAEWNDAQKPFGGLKLVITTDPNPDVKISWKDKAPEWGAVAPGKGPVQVTIESDDGLDSRGVTRTLKHELGHVEGLGHSAKSALMKEDAHSSTPGKAPSAADLNSKDPFTNPTADDLAGKKALWGTVEKLSKSVSFDTPTFNGGVWDYAYHLQALPGFIDPVTEYTIDLGPGVTLADLSNFIEPGGWSHAFFSGVVDAGANRPLDVDEAPSPSLLSFFALSNGTGLLPGQDAEFGFSSRFAPAPARAFTNSPSYDSDEFSVSAPAAVPEPGTWGLMGLGLLALSWRARRR